MPRAQQLLGQLSVRYCGSTRVACHAASTQSCADAASSTFASIDGKRPYHTIVDRSVGALQDGEVCTGARVCTCSSCRADTSTSRLPQKALVCLDSATHSALQQPGLTQSLNLGGLGLLSKKARAALASYPTISTSRHWRSDFNKLRAYSTVNDYQSQLDAINDAFVEARDEIEYAQEDSETVYFEEGLKTAQKAVREALQKYNELLDSLSEGERGKVQRSMGMKMEQLKAELHTVEQTHA